MNIIKLIRPLLVSGFFLSSPLVINAQVTDINGNTYKTVKIGTQTWMAENLNVSHFRNGEIIPQVKWEEDWVKAGEEQKPAWCYYNNDPKSEIKYGKLYNWYAVNDPRGLAPDGCHIPSDAEWTMLTDNLGGSKVAGKKMKSTSGWGYHSMPDYNANGTNSSSFTGLPGLRRSYKGNFTSDLGTAGHWWSSTEGSSRDLAQARTLRWASDAMPQDNDYKEYGLSVRCLSEGTNKPLGNTKTLIKNESSDVSDNWWDTHSLDSVILLTGTPPLSIAELINFRNQSTKAIEKILFGKNTQWMNASEGYTKAKFIAKGESAWKFGAEGVMDAMLFYSPFADQGDEFVGPRITFTTTSEDEYAALIREAGDIKDLKSCPESKHKQVSEIHFSGKDCNIIFVEENDFGYYSGIVKVYGKEKK